MIDWGGVLQALGDKPAVEVGLRQVSGATLAAMSCVAADGLQRQGVRCLAIELDNGAQWLALDLAAGMAGIPVVPLPSFFTPAQRAHALEAAGVDACAGSPGGAGFESSGEVLPGLPLWRRDTGPVKLPAGTAKVTFTSGTTGQPKGVCLSAGALDRVAAQLADATASVAIGRHLCLLPFPVLLENVAGARAAWLKGARVLAPSLTKLGWSGSSGIDFGRLLRVLREQRPDSLILLPQVLQGLVAALERSGDSIDFLRFAAVGGARTSPVLLARARALGLPVYEGYGLSENGSVVSLNLPAADRPGSVGKVLDPASLRISDRGLIEIRADGFLGYAGDPGPVPEWFDTGDLGALDSDGFLGIEGRSKNLLITGYGRNVSPEWVESELLAEEGLAQGVVFGEAWPGLAALVVAHPGTDIHEAVRRCNGRLPDYARVRAWRAIAPLEPASGLLTPNGRPRRDAIARVFDRELGEMRESMDGPVDAAPAAKRSIDLETHHAVL